MPFIPATNVIQAEMIYTWDGQFVENVLHYQASGSVTLVKMLGIGAELAAWFGATMDIQVPTTVSLIEVRLTDLTSEFAPGASWTGGLPLAGIHVSPSMPNNVALSITKRTNYRGRAYRGRIYHVGLGESGIVGNTVDPVKVTALLAAYEEIREITVAAETFPMVVLSRYEGNSPRSAALVTPVTSFSSDGIVDSQRRRLPKRGN